METKLFAMKGRYRGVVRVIRRDGICTLYSELMPRLKNGRVFCISPAGAISDAGLDGSGTVRLSDSVFDSTALIITEGSMIVSVGAAMARDAVERAMMAVQQKISSRENSLTDFRRETEDILNKNGEAETESTKCPSERTETCMSKKRPDNIGIEARIPISSAAKRIEAESEKLFYPREVTEWPDNTYGGARYISVRDGMGGGDDTAHRYDGSSVKNGVMNKRSGGLSGYGPYRGGYRHKEPFSPRPMTEKTACGNCLRRMKTGGIQDVVEERDRVGKSTKK